MRSSGRWLLGWALALGLLGPSPTLAQTKLTIIHVNDTHSHMEAFGPKNADLSGTIGGLEKAATVISTIRATESNTLFLHAGDVFHGDLFFNRYFGVPELGILKQLGVDAMAVGNHEFDFGPGVLAMALSNVGTFPMVSANLDLSLFPALGPLIQPRLIKDVGGVSVGIFGLTVPNDPTAQPAPVVIDGNVLPIAAQQVSALRGDGAQVVIALSHLGLAYDTAIAANVPGIDVIVGGHTHTALGQPLRVPNAGGATLIVQAGEFYEHVGRLRLVYQNGSVALQDYTLIPIDADVPPATPVQQTVDALKAGIVARYGDVYEEVLAFARRDVLKSYDPTRRPRDTGMGNLITDAYRWRTHTQIGLDVTGLISEGLYAGPIVGNDLFRPVSYGYDPATGLGLTLATFTITGAELLKGMETCLAYAGLTDTFDLQLSGLHFAYDSRRPVGQRVLLRTAHLHGRPFRLKSRYTVTTNAGIAGLLPTMGVTVENVQVLPDLEYNVLRDYVVHLGDVRYRSNGRVSDVAVHVCGHRPRAEEVTIDR